jgi:hypothetical protein
MKAVSSSNYPMDRIAQHGSGAVAAYAGRFSLPVKSMLGLSSRTRLCKGPINGQMDKTVARKSAIGILIAASPD